MANKGKKGKAKGKKKRQLRFAEGQKASIASSAGLRVSTKARNKKRRRQLNEAQQALNRLGLRLPKGVNVESSEAPVNLTPSQIADGIAMRHGADKVLCSFVESKWLDREGRTLELWTRGVILIYREKPIAVVCPTHAAFIDKSPVIWGVFTKPGPHWQEFWRRLTTKATNLAKREKRPQPPRHTSTDQLEEGRQQERVLVLDLDQRVGADDFASALDSTRRIREERTLALPVPAFIELDGLAIRLDPITSEGRAPIVPFEYGVGDEQFLKGAIYLASPETPIPIGVFEGSEDIWGSVAVTTLAAYADLTCLEVKSVNPKSEVRQPRKPRIGGANPQPGPPRVRSAPGRKSSTSWSQSLTIVGRNPLAGSSIVVGHIRRLGEGREASAEAVRKAREVGITLKKGETWVSPHIRGQAQVGELRFEWRREG